jgi:hypothetical protein
MKTKTKLNAYILRGSTGALLLSCVIVALCSAINLPGANGHASAATVAPSVTRTSRPLTFAERVAYQTAIEDVYWRHRIWPKSNPGPKPPLDKVMSQADIEKKVTEYLRSSQALEVYWHRPITADQLQAEMERMARDTKQPEVLQELFAALGNDPFVIAECLARPVLAERLVGEFSSGAKDASFRAKSRMERLGKPRHGREGRRLSERDVSESNPAAELTANSTRSFDFTQDDIAANLANAAYTLPVISDGPNGCMDDTWVATTLTNAPSARDQHTAVWTGSEMIVWGGGDGTNVFNTGGRYDPTTDSWIATSTTNAPSARDGHTAVWTGSEMIVWGGGDNTGGRYNPATDSWTATSTTNAPPCCPTNHTTVWTGSEMIVWGGVIADPLNTGGRYDPGTDTWTATSTTNAPSARYWHTAVWANTTQQMIVWGGWDNNSNLNTGGRYDPGTDSWIATSLVNAPAPRQYGYCGAQGAVWDDLDNLMIVWGGSAGGSGFNTGGRYNPSTDSWTATSLTNAPVGRTQHGAVWSGSQMIVWGGAGVSMPLNSGGRYDPVTNSWRATSFTNAPDGRRLLTAVWTGSEMIVWGGRVGAFTRINTGGRYCAAAASPTPTPTATATATASATATPTATPTATVRPTPTPRIAPTPRSRPTPAPRP